MARRHELVYALNAGGVDPDAISRVDLEKMRLAGEHPVSELLPHVLGPASLRPGSEMLARIPSDAQTRMIPMLRDVGTSYMLLLSPREMRVSLDGVIQQVPSVATTISTAGWSDVSAAGASATGGATLTFTATTTATAALRQTVTVASGDQATVNVLRVVVSAGPVTLRVGRTAGGDELLPDAELETGTHKIGVTPGTGTIYVEVRSDDPVTRSVSEIQFEPTGDFVLPTPWATFNDVQALRTWQSIDVLFCGDGTYQQRRIEHRGPLSWGIGLYKTDDGPFVGGSSRITMTAAALSGNTTLTASEAYWKAGHVGALVEVTSTGKTVTDALNGAGQTTDYVTIIETGAGRYFFRTGVGASFVGTLVLERSLEPDEPTSWTTFASYVDGAATFGRTQVDDGLTNITAHYRFRVSAYTSGSVTPTLEYESGVQVARARITGVTSATVAQVETIRAFGNTSSSRSWRIGDWSDLRGWPRTPVIHDSRLHWFRQDQHYASFPDDYYVFDDALEGDSAPFVRSVGTGGQSGVVWGESLDRLLAGTSAFEAVIAASELDEPLTQTQYTVRKPSRRGCADVPPAVHSDGLFFAQRSGRKLYELSLASGSSRFRSADISRLNPAAYRPGIVRLAVQQQPDTRLYAVLADGTMAVLTYERDDEVVAITSTTVAGALVEDVAVLPELDQDDVYVITNRGGQRYLERFAKEANQRAAATCALLDGHKVLTGSIASITGGAHFAGETVQVWADGQRRADVTLDGLGEASLGATYARVVYGKRYTATYKSVKLSYAAQLGAALGQTKIVRGAAMILSDACLDGISIGRATDDLGPLPDVINGAERTANQFFSHHETDIFPIQADWGTDARVVITVDSAEGPCTIQALVLDIETRDGVTDSQ